LFAQARRSTVDVAAGEVLWMPTGWWHTARACGEGPCVTITGSVVGEDTIEMFLDDYADYASARELVTRGAVRLQ
jgi:mannose-6-phosphate isomerase-like protein (cupin superfamily)